MVATESEVCPREADFFCNRLYCEDIDTGEGLTLVTLIRDRDKDTAGNTGVVEQ